MKLQPIAEVKNPVEGAQFKAPKLLTVEVKKNEFDSGKLTGLFDRMIEVMENEKIAQKYDEAMKANRKLPDLGSKPLNAFTEGFTAAFLAEERRIHPKFDFLEAKAIRFLSRITGLAEAEDLDHIVKGSPRLKKLPDKSKIRISDQSLKDAAGTLGTTIGKYHCHKRSPSGLNIQTGYIGEMRKILSKQSGDQLSVLDTLLIHV